MLAVVRVDDKTCGRTWDGGCCRKNAIGSCLGPLVGDVKADMTGDGVGDGAVKRSRGRPDEVIAVLDKARLAEEESAGRDRPPLPDSGVSSASSAKASNEMRSAAFLFGIALRDQP